MATLIANPATEQQQDQPQQEDISIKMFHQGLRPPPALKFSKPSDVLTSPPAAIPQECKSLPPSSAAPGETKETEEPEDDKTLETLLETYGVCDEEGQLNDDALCEENQDDSSLNPNPISHESVVPKEDRELTPLPEQLNMDPEALTQGDVPDPDERSTVSASSNEGSRPAKRLSTGTYENDDLLRDLSQENECLVKEDEDAAGDLGDLCHAVEAWKPFVDKVGKFMMSEKVPFEYFDVWVPVTTTKSDSRSSSPTGSEDSKDDSIKPDQVVSTSNSSSSGSESSLRLRHMGHGTNGVTELSSIFTMYQMNQFGTNSEKYSFPPGIGLPGRVFRANLPMWDDSLQQAPFRDFPRNKLAQRFGIKQGLAIPIVSDSLPGNQGSVVIAMYSTDYIRRDENLVRNAYRALLDQPCDESNQPSFSLIGAPCPAPQLNVPLQLPSDAIDHEAILPDETEVEMAHMLGRFYQDRKVRATLPLVCLLWRAPCRRTRSENETLHQLKQKFHEMQDNKPEPSSPPSVQSPQAAAQEEANVAGAIFTEWLQMVRAQREEFGPHCI